MSAKVVSIVNMKGGTAKTTLSLNLGIGLANQGKRVMLVDSDPSGDLTTALGFKNKDELPNNLATLINSSIEGKSLSHAADFVFHHKEEVDLIPSTIELLAIDSKLATTVNRERVLRDCLKQYKKQYDYIIVDTMPSISMININVLSASDSVIIPVQAQYLAAKGMTQVIQTIFKVKRQINPKLSIDGLVITLADMRTNLAKTVSDTLRENYGRTWKVYDTVIPISVRVAEATTAGKSIYAYAKSNKAAKAYEVLSKEVLQHAEKDRLRSSKSR